LFSDLSFSEVTELLSFGADLRPSKKTTAEDNQENM
jgi:hypothetical protein